MVFSIFSSIPNIGMYVDETICASKPCMEVKLRNPIILPYSWMFPEKKCNYCDLAENAYHILYESSFPVISSLNLIIGITYLLLLSFFLDFGFTQLRKSILPQKINKRKKIS